jgi:hypothetical protein
MGKKLGHERTNGWGIADFDNNIQLYLTPFVTRAIQSPRLWRHLHKIWDAHAGFNWSKACGTKHYISVVSNGPIVARY